MYISLFFTQTIAYGTFFSASTTYWYTVWYRLESGFKYIKHYRFISINIFLRLSHICSISCFFPSRLIFLKFYNALKMLIRHLKKFRLLYWNNVDYHTPVGNQLTTSFSLLFNCPIKKTLTSLHHLPSTSRVITGSEKLESV